MKDEANSRLAAFQPRYDQKSRLPACLFACHVRVVLERSKLKNAHVVIGEHSPFFAFVLVTKGSRARVSMATRRGVGRGGGVVAGFGWIDSLSSCQRRSRD